MSGSGAPDYIQPIAGVRIWRVAPNLLAQHMGLLWGPGAREPWPTGKEHRVACESGADTPDHEPPGDDCGCGLYACFTPQLAIEGGYWPTPDYGQLYNRLVAGVIGAAGDIVPADYGLRAERATVEALFTVGVPDSELPLTRQAIADAYGVSVIRIDEYEEFCERAGLLVVTDPDAL